ncbi:uncharacterized protein LOC126749795 isoform X2 [Anthonomus grandis grandis]|uniref:uncharacterized protein LOC126749795 isoform X2 n=1 Tax=Anthonomus grandis grandis TaxID=2921223 RepID=UPI002165E868|nr:uncharacterized protein LOC126749795 isoform X2 [Anthonomus grandis grandis]
MLESKEPVAKRRRGVVNSSKYLRNQVKYGRTHGKQYLNYKGNSVSAKTIGKPCSCPMKWFIKVDEDNRKCVFTKFYEMSSKNEQDTYIQGRIEICGVKRRRKITQPDYIHKEINENVTELHLFCDNCPGQNKNLCMVKMCMALKSTGRFDKISQYFPIRGHSFLPCDRAFGTIKRKRQELFDCQGSCHRRDVKF